MQRIMLLIVALCALTLGSAMEAFAQETGPEGGFVPDPAECTVEPRSVQEVIDLWFPNGTPVAASPSPVMDEDMASPVAIDVPAGEPADAETIDAVTATVREVFACFNANDFGRALALYSDDLLIRTAPEIGLSMEDARAFFEQESVAVPEDQRQGIIAVTDVTVTEDGRVAAIVVTNDPTVEPEGAETSLVYFVEVDGRWLIDDVIENAVGAADTPGGNLVATPEP